MTYTQILMDFQLRDLNPVCAGVAYRTPPGAKPPLRRSHALVHYVLSGRGFLYMNDQVYPVSAGQAFIIPTGCLASYGPDPEDPWTYRWVGFTGKLSHGFAYFPPVVDLPASFVEGLCDPTMPGVELKAVAYQLVAELLTLYSILGGRSCDDESGEIDSCICAILDYIQSHHTEKLSVEAIADQFHHNRTYLYKRFKDKIGCSMSRYILDVRLMTAMRLIESGKSFKETAYLSGFRDQSNFSKVFTRETGKTPSEWKQYLLDNFESFRKYKANR